MYPYDRVIIGRSRKGAWIEITATADKTKSINSRSRKGAWIEISCRSLSMAALIVAPVRERGLK